MDTNLVAYVRGKVAAKRGDWPALAKTLGVSYSWLSKFADDNYPHDVGYRRLEKMAAHFRAEDERERRFAEFLRAEAERAA